MRGVGYEDVVRVLGDGGNQSTRTLQARLPEHLVVGRITVYDRLPVAGSIVERSLVRVDYGDRPGLEAARDQLAVAPPGCGWPGQGTHPTEPDDGRTLMRLLEAAGATLRAEGGVLIR